ncbi:MAG: AMP-binding protein [Flavobacteriaceae bacterium]|nr:AMP-binding protein [Flavobacteriaceae bacterium]
MSNKKYHIDFKLNEKSFDTVESLLIFSKTISKDMFCFLENWFDTSNFININTSGSIGKPKLIKLKKKYMINSALATGKYFDLPSKTTVLLCLSLNYIAGKMMLIRALVLGWHLDIVEPKSNPLLTIEKKYNFSAMIPMQLNNSLTKISLISKLIVGGGAVSKNLQHKIKNIKTQVFATYGMTETITHIAIKPLNKASGLSFKNNAYQVLPNVMISKDNRDCLVIDALNVSDKTLVTNDIVDLISNSTFEWLGRFDNVINSGGVKLIPEQIEKKISAVIDCRFFVTSISDELLGKKLILIIERSVQKNLKSQILELKTLSKFEKPKKIYFVNKFILTETGKINRSRTRELIV